MRKIWRGALALVVVGMLAVPVAGLAETNRGAVKGVQGLRAEVKETRGEIRTEAVKERREIRTEAVKERREVLRQEVTEAKDAFRVKVEEMKGEREENLGGLLKARQVEVKEQLVERRQEARDAYKENLEAAREARGEAKEKLKAEVKKITDQNKAAAMLRVADQTGLVNEKVTAQMTAAVDKLEEILARIETRADEATAAGKDTVAADTVAGAAREAIAAARTAIEEQAAKIYEISFESEGTLRTDVGEVRRQMASDLKSTRQEVVAAREAVRNVLLALKSVPGVDEAE